MYLFEDNLTTVVKEASLRGEGSKQVIRPQSDASLSQPISTLNPTQSVKASYECILRS